MDTPESTSVAIVTYSSGIPKVECIDLYDLSVPLPICLECGRPIEREATTDERAEIVVQKARDFYCFLRAHSTGYFFNELRSLFAGVPSEP